MALLDSGGLATITRRIILSYCSSEFRTERVENHHEELLDALRLLEE